MKTSSFILMIILAGQVVAGPQKERFNALNLTEDQKTQMQEVKQQQQEKLQLAREQIMSESMALMAEFLTPEQLAQVQQKQDHRKAHGGERKHHRKMKRKGHKKNQDVE